MNYSLNAEVEVRMTSVVFFDRSMLCYLKHYTESYYLHIIWFSISCELSMRLQNILSNILQGMPNWFDSFDLLMANQEINSVRH